MIQSAIRTTKASAKSIGASLYCSIVLHQSTNGGHFSGQRDEDKVVLLDKFQDGGRWHTSFATR